MTKSKLLLVVSIVLILLLPSAMLLAENNDAKVTLFAPYWNNAESTLFLADGRLLFLLRNMDETFPRSVQSLQCFSVDMQPLWSFPIADAVISDFSSVFMHADGTIILIYQSADFSYTVVRLSASGELLQETNLPAGTRTPVASNYGVFFTRNDGAESSPTLFALGNDGAVKTIATFSQYGFMYLGHASDHNGNTYFTAEVIAAQGTTPDAMARLLFCVNASGDVVWSHDFGLADEWTVRLWAGNTSNGVTIAAERHPQLGAYVQNPLVVICLDGMGKELWRREVTHGDSYYILPLLMDQTEQGTHQIWGSASLSMADTRLFYLALDESGNFVENTFWNYDGSLYSYLDGNIVAVTHDDPAQLTPLRGTTDGKPAIVRSEIVVKPAPARR